MSPKHVLKSSSLRESRSPSVPSHHEVRHEGHHREGHREVRHESRHEAIKPRYTHTTYPPFPPLFILTDKHTNYSKLMETYDSIFTPKPPIHPPPLPAYTKCNCGDSNCLIITPPVCSPPPPYRESEHSYRSESPYARKSTATTENHYRESAVESVTYRREGKKTVRPSSEYDLPNVDEHFRKSLGDKYDIIKCQQANEPPSSVDDHFAKALGQKWFKMEYGNKKSMATKT